MNSPIFAAVAVLFIAWFDSVIYYTYWWQLKEYRWDRMRDFLASKSGRAKVFSWLFWMKIILLPVFLGVVFWGDMSSARVVSLKLINFSIFLDWIFVGATILEIQDMAYRLFKRKLYRPDLTAKSLMVMATVGLMVVLICLSALGWDLGRIDRSWVVIWVGFYFAYLVTPLLVPFAVLLFYPVTLISKGFVLGRAHAKIAKMQGLKVIGITGSYGKSSVKEILAQILGAKFQVLKTPGNTNTEIGVAGIVLKHLKASDEVFIVECGAYKIGEIRKIAEMVSPRIGIITAVKDAHLAMFGSLENIKKAKFELIESLPEFGTAIFNADDENAAELAGKADGMKLAKVIRYGLAGKAELSASEIRESIDGLVFKVNGVDFQSALPGRHNVSNILAASAAAMEFGMSLEEIAEQVRKVKLRERTLTVWKPRDGLVLLDDTYNANPDGVMAGLHYLGLFEDWQKIIVFPGMLELGERSEPEHERVGAKIAEICNFAYLTSRDFEKALLKSFQEKKFQDYEFIVDDQLQLLAGLQKKIAERKTVILLVSRGSEMVLKKLRNGV